jgi:hypothetical protein
MSTDEPVFVCINSSEEMKREEQAIAGQLWVQGDRQMTASNIAPQGMANTRESAHLYAAAEAVTWNHASQPDSPRKGQRVVIFPKDLPQLDEFLVTCDPNADSEDGHSLAYEAILRESQKFETTPLFLREDCDMVVNDPLLAANVPEWLPKSRQVATGNSRRVLEDGADVMSSSDEDDPKMKPDELTGVYTAEMDPKAGPQVLSPSQAAYQRAVGKARKEQMILSAPRVASPLPEEVFSATPQVDLLKSGGSSDDDTLDKPEYIWSVSKGANRRNKAWVRRLADSSLALPAPEPERKEVGESVTRSRAVTDPTSSKAAASKRAPADNPTKEAKAPKPVKGQESPETKVSTPMVTGQTASGAGGFRPGGGSGQTDTCVANGSPSKT